jgi:hypothetical protein
MNIRPLPPKFGVGFTSNEKLDVKDYTHEEVGRFHNYLFNSAAWKWPENRWIVPTETKVVDGFSPNLNKELHLGHLRQLALANAFRYMLPHWKFVAILGASLGYHQQYKDKLLEWLKFTGYKPEIYYDVLMPQDQSIVPRRPGTGKNSGAMVWLSPELDENGRQKEVVVTRSNLVEYVCNKEPRGCGHSFYMKEGQEPIVCPHCDEGDWFQRGKSTVQGKNNYVFADIAFAATVKPDYYITGLEQREHFQLLGMKDKHLPMGLVLGADGKKLKSRSGDAMTGEEGLEMVQSHFKDTPNPKELAWNCLAWNFLRVNRDQNVKFDPERWTLPDAAGLYITYTYARLYSALAKAFGTASPLFKNCQFVYPPTGSGHGKEPMQPHLRPCKELTELDVNILGWVEYGHYWLQRSRETLDTAPFANYLHDLCRVLGEAYNKERIKDGREEFRQVILFATAQLRIWMEKLGLFAIEEV